MLIKQTVLTCIAVLTSMFPYKYIGTLGSTTAMYIVF